MNRSEAPAPGWYPDPVQRARLRWWDGSDWADHRRVGPRPADLLDPDDDPSSRRSWSTAAQPAHAPRPGAGPPTGSPGRSGTSGITRNDASVIVDEVRRATRGELDRATSRLAAQAGNLRTQLEPLIQDYGRRFLRWARRAALIAVVIYVLYVVTTTQLQTSVLDWLGEQVDKLVTSNGG